MDCTHQHQAWREVVSTTLIISAKLRMIHRTYTFIQRY
jgi:hypothetical protein